MLYDVGGSIGRPKGSKNGVYAVQSALIKAGEAVSAISELENMMSDKQRMLFESLMSGDNELVATIKSGNNSYFTGITKKVTLNDGTYLMTSRLKLDDVQDLDTVSYNRLLSICRSQVRKVLATDDYRKYTEPIREYIKRLSPMALGTIASIAQTGKEENRLKAAKDLLDRAGEREPEPEKDVIIPVQVNILLTNHDGSVTAYTDGSVRTQSE